MEARATGKFIKGSPQKARLVIDLIRGKSVQDALAILRFAKKRATGPLPESCSRPWPTRAEERHGGRGPVHGGGRGGQHGADQVAAATPSGSHGPGLPAAAPLSAHQHHHQGAGRREA